MAVAQKTQAFKSQSGIITSLRYLSKEAKNSGNTRIYRVIENAIKIITYPDHRPALCETEDESLQLIEFLVAFTNADPHVQEKVKIMIETMENNNNGFDFYNGVLAIFGKT